MTPFPLPLADLMGHWGSYVVYLLIGFSFGYVLELAGFGQSTKLAAQFYLRDMTVLKVMFTGIIVAMVLIFWTTSLGLLDYNLIWVNPTYIWSGMIGGLIMGFGFIIGGFCPGTSLVSAATGKIDGIFFAGGVFFGIFMFGETVGYMDRFFNATYLGRFTLQEYFNVDAGIVVLGVVVMALFMFWGGEQLERIIGKRDLSQDPRWRYVAAVVILLAAGGLVFVGQPTNADRWEALSVEKEPLLADGQYQIHPGELLDLQNDRKLIVRMIDVRSESDFNMFHLRDAEHVSMDDLPNFAEDLYQAPANSVFVVMSNDETRSTDAWRYLVAESIPNVYILEGGINGWLNTLAEADEHAAEELVPIEGLTSDMDEVLRYDFELALGSRHPLSAPEHALELEYVSKVVLETKRGPTSGGCG